MDSQSHKLGVGELINLGVVPNSILKLLLGTSLVLLACVSLSLRPSGSDQSVKEKQKSLNLTVEDLIAQGIEPLKRQRNVPEFDTPLAQFQTVFWDPADTESLREYLGKLHWGDQRVLDIGTGTGYVALVCWCNGARETVALDINQVAVANAEFNYQSLNSGEFSDASGNFEVRRVALDSGNPFDSLRSDERFDLVISNPPWENHQVDEVAGFAFYDHEFLLMKRILSETHSVLSEDGELLLVYGAKQAITKLQELAPFYEWRIERLDSRSLDDLPEVFLPGMLFRLTPVSTN